VTRTVHVEDGNGDPLTVTWSVDNVVVQVDQVPSGGSTTSADLSMTHFYSLGVHTLHIEVDDGTAPPVACNSSVSVVDHTPPVVQCTNRVDSLWPPNHKLVPVGLVATANDGCAGPVQKLSVEVFGDEDDETQTGDGKHSPDAKNIANGTLRLRSERRGDADGRVYLILAMASDPSGNTAVNCCAVTVSHSQRPLSQQSVALQAAAAVATCQATGAPPGDYFVVGDGPEIGPHQ